MAAAERRTVAAERISTWTRQKITVVPMVSKGGAAAERMGCKAAAAAPAAGAGVLQLSSAPSGRCYLIYYDYICVYIYIYIYINDL